MSYFKFNQNDDLDLIKCVAKIVEKRYSKPVLIFKHEKAIVVDLPIENISVAITQHLKKMKGEANE